MLSQYLSLAKTQISKGINNTVGNVGHSGQSQPSQGQRIQSLNSH